MDGAGLMRLSIAARLLGLASRALHAFWGCLQLRFTFGFKAERAGRPRFVARAARLPAVGCLIGRERARPWCRGAQTGGGCTCPIEQAPWPQLCSSTKQVMKAEIWAEVETRWRAAAQPPSSRLLWATS